MKSLLLIKCISVSCLCIGLKLFSQDLDPPYPRLGIFTFSGNEEACLDILKDFHIITLWKDQTALAAKYKEQNPDCIVLANSTSLAADYFSDKLPDEWFYLDIEGNRQYLFGEAYLMNCTNVCPKVDINDGRGPKRFIDHVRDYLTDNFDFTVFDGVFHDWWWSNPGGWARTHGDLNLNGITDRYEMSADSIVSAWILGKKECHDMVYEIPGVDYVVIQLGCDCGVWPHVHGACFEDFPIYHGPWSYWRSRYMDNRTNTKTPKLMMFNASHSHFSKYFPVYPYKNNYRSVRFGLGSCLLTSAYFFVDEGGQIGHHGNIHIYDEFAGNGRLGYPVSEGVSIPGKPNAPTPNAVGVWVRFFDNGVSLVNASGVDQMIYASDLAALDPSPSEYFRFQGGQDPLFNNGQQVTDSNPLILWGNTAKAAWNDREVFGDGAMLFRSPDTLITPIVVDNHVNNQTSPGSEPIQHLGSWRLAYDGSKHYAAYKKRDYSVFQPNTHAWSPPGSGENTAIYVPTIGVSAYYEVMEWHGDRDGGARATNVPIRIFHAAGDTTRRIDQSVNIGRWNSLGIYPFLRGFSGRVELSNDANGVVLADAIQFVFRRGLTSAEEDSLGQEVTLLFTDDTESWIGNSGNGCRGLNFADITGNGLPDLFVARHNGANTLDQLYINYGTHFKEDAFNRNAHDQDDGSQGACWADLDNDGDFDLVIGSTMKLPEDVAAHNDIYENTGGGYFVRATPQIMLDNKQKTRNVVAVDFAGNGFLDLFCISGYLGTDDGDQNEVYGNHGDFAIGLLGPIETGDLRDAPAGHGGVATDYDGDGDMDIIAANQTGPLNILRNNGSGGYVRIHPSDIGINHRAGTGISMGDVNNNGHMDMLLVSKLPSSVAYLYLNNGDGTFTYSGQEFQNVMGYMGGFADLDNDGFLDLVFAGYPRVFMNDGTGVFAPGPVIPYGYPSLTNVYSMAFADVDNDGDLDFAVADAGGKVRLIRNQLSNANHWLKIKVTNPNGQAGGFGAKVMVYPARQVGGELLAFREITSTYGFTGQDDPVVHVGLGDHSAVDVVILFLDGTRQTRTYTQVNRTVQSDAPDEGIWAQTK